KGRTKEIITSEKEGLTCNPEDIAALAAGIQKLMADEELRKTIQQNAIERSKFFSLDNIISLWEKFLYNDMKIQKS
ncbi:MAG: glycosyltransferase, partial [Aeriscardovia sp.]|nr:glycosyltransferase [Aeriscardovia sp.]